MFGFGEFSSDSMCEAACPVPKIENRCLIGGKGLANLQHC